MRTLIKRLLARRGLALRHVSGDPVLREAQRVCDELRLSPGDDARWHHELSRLPLLQQLRALLARHRPELVIDVGANRGQFARQLRALGYAGRILSLEPQSALAARLACEADPDWTVLHGGAGERDETLALNVYADDTFSSLHSVNADARACFGELVRPMRVESVRIRPLDDWIESAGLSGARSIFLKTDTQSHDPAVLRGAPRTLARTSMLLAEASLIPLYDQDASLAPLLALTAANGFSVAGLFGVSQRPDDLATIEFDCLFTRSRPAEPTDTDRAASP